MGTNPLRAIASSHLYCVRFLGFVEASLIMMAMLRLGLIFLVPILLIEFLMVSLFLGCRLLALAFATLEVIVIVVQLPMRVQLFLKQSVYSETMLESKVVRIIIVLWSYVALSCLKVLLLSILMLPPAFVSMLSLKASPL
ncbi:unnamed protein product [Prorocentrum cordatum]|uniref:Uncharacterized protein n=1 Tax=Prorocentrum cordatum TaxID=2364126 RepID=A0ABN9UWN1_9DINO|nr:unnamed protein product [Polarella glacialis]